MFSILVISLTISKSMGQSLRDVRVDLPVDIVRRDRHAVVVEDGDELCGGGSELDHHQAAELGVAVLLDDEHRSVLVDEIAKRFTERERAGTHGIEVDALFG